MQTNGTKFEGIETSSSIWIKWIWNPANQRKDNKRTRIAEINRRGSKKHPKINNRKEKVSKCPSKKQRDKFNACRHLKTAENPGDPSWKS